VTEQNPEDYVLVHKRKAKISRARKMIIGVMAVGTVAALTGAGTFASFSASTTNDATFKTGTIVLTNKVASGNTCWSSKVDNSNAPANDPTLDVNDTTCDALFAANLLPGTSYTAVVQVRNEGTTNGILKMFAPTPCTNGAGAAKTNAVQRLIVSPGATGNFTVTYGAATTGPIAAGASAATLQSALQGLASIGTGNVTVSKDGNDFLISFVGTLGGQVIAAVTLGTAGITVGTVTVAAEAAGGSTLPSGSGATMAAVSATGPCGRVNAQIQEVDSLAGTNAAGTGCVYPFNNVTACASSFGALSGLPAFGPSNALGAMVSGATRFFKVTVKLPTGTTATTGVCTQTGIYSFDSSSGVGCDNYLMNTKASVDMRWQLQDA
jgi:predicted ribosomally synthesized peptide with SipW-like signal peptide